MLKQTNIYTSGAILLWYLIGASAGWKGWAPAVGTMGGGSGYSSGTRPGGHGSFYGGGWGGGK